MLAMWAGFSNAQLAIGRANAVGGLAVAPQRDLRVVPRTQN
jgi:hypothetical protein